jgi:hypothetical protein
VATPPQPAQLAAVGQSKKGLAWVSLAFSDALNPGSATNPSQYVVYGAVKKRGKAVYSKPLPIRSVTYNAAMGRVTINLSKPYKGAVQVTVHAGLMAANGGSSTRDVSIIA